MGSVTDKLQECRLRWYGQVRACQSRKYLRWKCLAMSISGVGPPGRPWKCWLDVMLQDMRANGLTTEDVTERAKWGRLNIGRQTLAIRRD